MSTEEQIAQLQAQQAKTVEVLRRTLEGKWDEARVWLDAIDPAHAGTWHEAPFPPKAPSR